MKKLWIVFIAVIATVTLSSFVINKNHDKQSNMSSDLVYYTSVTAWTDATESYTKYIYYREANGAREYLLAFSKDPTNRQYYSISKNPLYKSNACNDFRRNYRYESYGYYFNCNLPYFK